MKAKPVRIVPEEGYIQCAVDDATHVQLNFPSPAGTIFIPVILKGRREGTGCWTWNGDTERPTLRPSVLTTGHNFRCHSWVNDGQAQFLSDSDHALSGQTVDLVDI